MVKVIFVLHRKLGLTREECLSEWAGDQHRSFVEPMRALGLRKWVRNQVTSPERIGAPDGLGELWFDDAAAMERVMNSDEMGRAAEDGARFLESDRCYALVVDETDAFE